MLGSEMVFWQNHGNIALRVLRFKMPVRHEVSCNPQVPASYPNSSSVTRAARTSLTAWQRTWIRFGNNVRTLEEWLIAGGKGLIGPGWRVMS